MAMLAIVFGGSVAVVGVLQGRLSDALVSEQRGDGAMALSDDQLLDFDSSNYAKYDESKAREALAGEHGEVFRAQLVAARWIDGWRERTVEHDRESPTGSSFTKDYSDGWDAALRNVTAYLRQGDLIPGGVLHYETLTDSY
jgi:hypothetical protein